MMLVELVARAGRERDLGEWARAFGSELERAWSEPRSGWGLLAAAAGAGVDLRRVIRCAVDCAREAARPHAAPDGNASRLLGELDAWCEQRSESTGLDLRLDHGGLVPDSGDARAWVQALGRAMMACVHGSHALATPPQPAARRFAAAAAIEAARIAQQACGSEAIAAVVAASIPAGMVRGALDGAKAPPARDG